MNNPLRTPEDYELFLYTLVEQFPSIRHSTVTFVRRGASLARTAGELHFDHPNLPVLILEIETLIKKVENEAKSK